MKRRDLFKLATGSVAAFLVGKYGVPATKYATTVHVTISADPGFPNGALVRWVPCRRIGETDDELRVRLRGRMALAE